MIQASTSQDIDLLELYKLRQVNQLTSFVDIAMQLNPDILMSNYLRLISSAPMRHSRNLKYFVGHTGITSSGSHSNRREEHLATALWNQTREYGPLEMPDIGELDMLDYQFPLKARRSDKGVGKVDLFGIIGNRKPCVIELKIHPAGTGRGDTPLRAFLEALAYCAIVEANAGDIAHEALYEFDYKLSENRPALMVMATEEYWSAYINYQKAGNWWPVLSRLADELEESFGLECHFLAIRNAKFRMGLNGEKPAMLDRCQFIAVSDLPRWNSTGSTHAS